MVRKTKANKSIQRHTRVDGLWTACTVALYFRRTDELADVATYVYVINSRNVMFIFCSVLLVFTLRRSLTDSYFI